MAEFILLMHNDYDGQHEAAWDRYLAFLSAEGALRGGSAIGSGVAMRRTGKAADVTPHLAGYVKIEARDLDHARLLVAGNPVYEAGGTVEIRELPRSDR